MNQTRNEAEWKAELKRARDRESARRSRKRKQDTITGLAEEVARLKVENEALRHHIAYQDDDDEPACPQRRANKVISRVVGDLSVCFGPLEDALVHNWVLRAGTCWWDHKARVPADVAAHLGTAEVQQLMEELDRGTGLTSANKSELFSAVHQGLEKISYIADVIRKIREGIVDVQKWARVYREEWDKVAPALEKLCLSGDMVNSNYWFLTWLLDKNNEIRQYALGDAADNWTGESSPNNEKQTGGGGGSSNSDHSCTEPSDDVTTPPPPKVCLSSPPTGDSLVERLIMPQKHLNSPPPPPPPISNGVKKNVRKPRTAHTKTRPNNVNFDKLSRPILPAPSAPTPTVTNTTTTTSTTAPSTLASPSSTEREPMSLSSFASSFNVLDSSPLLQTPASLLTSYGAPSTVTTSTTLPTSQVIPTQLMQMAFTLLPTGNGSYMLAPVMTTTTNAAAANNNVVATQSPSSMVLANPTQVNYVAAAGGGGGGGGLQNQQMQYNAPGQGLLNYDYNNNQSPTNQFGVAPAPTSPSSTSSVPSPPTTLAPTLSFSSLLGPATSSSSTFQTLQPTLSSMIDSLSYNTVLSALSQQQQQHQQQQIEQWQQLFHQQQQQQQQQQQHHHQQHDSSMHSAPSPSPPSSMVDMSSLLQQNGGPDIPVREYLPDLPLLRTQSLSDELLMELLSDDGKQQ